MKFEIHFEENETIDNFAVARALYKLCEQYSPILNAKSVAEMILIQHKEDYENERER